MQKSVPLLEEDIFEVKICHNDQACTYYNMDAIIFQKKCM